MTSSTSYLIVWLLIAIFEVSVSSSTVRPPIWKYDRERSSSIPNRQHKVNSKHGQNIKTSFHQSRDLYHCRGKRNRREIRDLSAKERSEWAKALLELRSQPSGFNNLSEWDALIVTHMQFTDEAYGGAYFLPWHRLFLLRLENLIRKKHSDFTLPYWDWSLDASDAALSPIWHSSLVGRSAPGPAMIQDGPFYNLSANYPWEHFVARDFRSAQSGQIRPLWNNVDIDKLVLWAKTWADFANGIETAHTYLHYYIGGDMNTLAFAPNDPLFYLHHAFVDSLWSRRQAYSRNMKAFGGTHDFAVDELDAVDSYILEAFLLPVRAAFYTSCVHYLPPKKALPSSTGPIPTNICELTEFIDDPLMTETRCARGMSILRAHAAARSETVDF